VRIGESFRTPPGLLVQEADQTHGPGWPISVPRRRLIGRPGHSHPAGLRRNLAPVIAIFRREFDTDHWAERLSRTPKDWLRAWRGSLDLRSCTISMNCRLDFFPYPAGTWTVVISGPLASAPGRRTIRRAWALILIRGKAPGAPQAVLKLDQVTWGDPWGATQKKSGLRTIHSSFLFTARGARAGRD